ncbi:DUF6338 family protein [Actinomadura sp. K4S16]|uniref:DUF6338 family protein n=1 Tax=Actinomadura sp. K4S16 TaxID=1316147 RepID=UPI0011EF8FF6|nr:DUF6338 family protein [Actinomadura sp. K4S16]
MQPPTTVTQLTIVLLLILPGVAYQFVRERSRGPLPVHKDLGERILRALAASAIINAAYVIIGGDLIVHLVYDDKKGWLSGSASNYRLIAITAIALLIVVPTMAAWGVSLWSGRKRAAAYDATPTAWDDAFKNRGPCFVRVRLKSGRWIGGWYGRHSYASGYPQPADLYLQTAWEVSPMGYFIRPLEQSSGIYIRMEEVECLDFIESTREEGDDGESGPPPVRT